MSRHILAAALLLGAAAAQAEVAVRTDRNGNYAGFRAGSHSDPGGTYYWDRNGGPADDVYLNEGGDDRGDAAPAAVVAPAGKQQNDPTPVVVWPRQDGDDLDIVFSRWLRGSGWSSPRSLGLQNDVDDLDVVLFLDPRNDVHAVWWTDGSTEAVYYSKFVNGNWTTPERVSNLGVDSHHPGFSFSDNQLLIRYTETRNGRSEICSFLKEDFDP